MVGVQEGTRGREQGGVDMQGQFRSQLRNPQQEKRLVGRRGQLCQMQTESSS